MLHLFRFLSAAGAWGLSLVALLPSPALPQSPPSTAPSAIKSATRVEYTYPKGKEQVSKSVVHYDEAGKKAEEITYNADGTLKRTEKYFYDAHGKRTKKTIHSSKGALKETVTYRYDNRGNLTEESSSDADGKLLKRTLYSYDDRNSETSRTEYDGNGKVKFKRTKSYEYYK